MEMVNGHSRVLATLRRNVQMLAKRTKIVIMHLYPPQESVICLDFVASSQGRDGLDTEEVISNHVFRNKNWNVKKYSNNFLNVVNHKNYRL